MTESAGGSERRIGAVEAALIAIGAPDRVALLPPHPLPEGAIDLIRVAAGDDAHAASLAQRFGVEVRRINDAALHFVHVVMFHPDSDHFRVLGATPDADDETLKLHFRWLQKWLHPDRDPEGWVSAYAERVNVAWAQLRRPDRRETYRQQLRDRNPVAVMRTGLAEHPGTVDRADIVARPPRLISSRLARRVPSILAVTTVVFAVLIFGAHRAGEKMLAEERHRAEQARAGATSEEGARVAWSTNTTARNSAGASAFPLQRQHPDPPPHSVPPAEPALDASAPTTDKRSSSQLAQQDPRVEANLAQASLPEPRDRMDAGDRSSASTEALGSRAGPGDAGTDHRDDRPLVSVPIKVDVGDPASSGSGDVLVMNHEQDVASVSSVQAGAESAIGERSVSAATLPATASSASLDVSALEARSSRPASIDDGLKPPTLVDPSAGRRLLNQFSAAYRSGEIQQVVILFAPNARTPSGNLLNLYEQYRATFASSSKRSLEFLDVEWRVLPNGLEGVGRYEWAMRPRSGAASRATSGRMRVVIELIDGRPLIAVLDQQDVG